MCSRSRAVALVSCFCLVLSTAATALCDAVAASDASMPWRSSLPPMAGALLELFFTAITVGSHDRTRGVGHCTVLEARSDAPRRILGSVGVALVSLMMPRETPSPTCRGISLPGVLFLERSGVGVGRIPLPRDGGPSDDNLCDAVLGGPLTLSPLRSLP